MFTVKLTVKPIVAHGVRADRLSRVRWKDILGVHNSPINVKPAGGGGAGHGVGI